MWDPATLAETEGDVGRLARFVAALEGEFVVCSSGVPGGEWQPQDIAQPIAERLNALGAICAALGHRLAYHNHSWEAKGDCLALLAEMTTPEEVAFAFDTGNHLEGGGDPISAIRLLGSRLVVLHVKDYGPDCFRPLGEGQVDLAGVKTALHGIGYDGWLVLEEEGKPADPRSHVTHCLEILRGLMQ